MFEQDMGQLEDHPRSVDMKPASEFTITDSNGHVTKITSHTWLNLEAAATASTVPDSHGIVRLDICISGQKVVTITMPWQDPVRGE